MSETERLKGEVKLIHRAKSHQELHDFCKNTYVGEIPHYYDGDYIEALTDGTDYFVVQDKFELWEIVKSEEFEEYYAEISPTDDVNKFKFKTVFYNGGTCLTEVLESAIHKMYSK